MSKYLITAATLIWLIGCSQVTDPCPSDIASYSKDFNVTGIADIVVSRSAGDSTGNTVTDASTTISVDELQLNVTLEYTESTSNSASAFGNPASMLAGLLIKSAHACSPRGHRLTSKVVGLNLISNSVLSESYPPGESLGSVFIVEPATANFANTFFAELLDQISIENPLADSVNFTIKPTSLTTDNTAQHRFTLTIDLENGQSFSIDTDVTLSPGG